MNRGNLSWVTHLSTLIPTFSRSTKAHSLLSCKGVLTTAIMNLLVHCQPSFLSYYLFSVSGGLPLNWWPVTMGSTIFKTVFSCLICINYMINGFIAYGFHHPKDCPFSCLICINYMLNGFIAYGFHHPKDCFCFSPLIFIFIFFNKMRLGSIISINLIERWIVIIFEIKFYNVFKKIQPLNNWLYIINTCFS